VYRYWTNIHANSPFTPGVHKNWKEVECIRETKYVGEKLHVLSCSKGMASILVTQKFGWRHWICFPGEMGWNAVIGPLKVRPCIAAFPQRKHSVLPTEIPFHSGSFVLVKWEPSFRCDTSSYLSVYTFSSFYAFYNTI